MLATIIKYFSDMPVNRKISSPWLGKPTKMQIYFT